jgi:hypothetical protein
LSVTTYYDLTLQILDKSKSTPTPIGTGTSTLNAGRIVNGDLTPYRASLVLTNTGNTKTDSGVLTLRIPPDGTFIRQEPVLVNQNAKDLYVIQAQIRQSDGSGGTRNGKVFRFIIGTPTIDDSVGDGETLTLNLLPIEYRLKEHLQSKQLYFFTPRDSFERRLWDYNSTKGSDNPQITFSSITPTPPVRPHIDLPDDDTLKQNWLPSAPKDTHSLLHDIISKMSLPSTSGGTFTDYYFDMESNNISGDISTGNINEVEVRAEPFGYEDSGVVIDPLSVISPVDAEQDKTVVADMQRFKNNIILEGSPRYGSLPMDRTKFNSQWQHGKVRPEYDSSSIYYDGSDGVNNQSLIKLTVSTLVSGTGVDKTVERYFKYIGTNGVVPWDNPIIFSSTSWYEDFTTIPEYSDKAQYEEKEVITKTNTVTGVIEFFQLKPNSISSISSISDKVVQVVTIDNHGLIGGEKFGAIEGTVNFNLRKTDIATSPVLIGSGGKTFQFGKFGNNLGSFPTESTGFLLGCNTHYKGDATPTDGVNGWVKIFNDTNTSKYKAFWSYTPWTSNYDLQESNLSGVPSIPLWSSSVQYQGNPARGDEVEGSDGKWYRAFNNSGSTSGGAVDPTTFGQIKWYKLGDSIPTWSGTVPDWNFERANFDRVKSEDQFEQISMKAVYRVVTFSSEVPTTAEKQNGSRFLLNGATDATWNNTDFSGTNNNKVVEWHDPLHTGGEWIYSKTPTNKEEEIVTDLSTGKIFGWKSLLGSTTVFGWQEIWSPNTLQGKSSTAFHCASNGNILSGGHLSKMGFGLVTGSTQIPAQAIRLLFNWDTIYGSKLNFSSRGAWYVMHLPMPRKAMGSTAIGDIYKQSTLDTVNLDLDSKGGQGWNNGVDSEDLGRISALTMKIRLSGYDASDTGVNGYANMPFKAWAIDVFGRVWFDDFTVRRMGQYDHVRITFGERAGNKLHHNRIDELFSLLGFTFSQNFFVKEKEFTGIAFDWRFVKSWGLFWNIGYDDNGMYIGSRDNWKDVIQSWASQAWASTLSNLSANNIPLERFVIEYVTLDIDELAFEKQMFANSDDVTLTEPRTELMSEPNEIDYNNLKLNAKAKKARKKFIPQQWYIRSHGDVRMRLGKKFKITGKRVPDNPDLYELWYPTGLTPSGGSTNYAIGTKVKRNVGGVDSVYQSIKYPNQAKIPESQPTYWINLNESVCQQVVHTIDSSGYTMSVTGVRKFVYSE